MPVHEILELIIYAQKLPFNIHADVSSRARGINCGLSLHLYPCFVNASSGGLGESAYLRRLASAKAA